VRKDPVALSYWTRRESQLLADAREIDDQAVALRSSTTPHGPDGLAALRDWLLEIPPAQSPASQASALALDDEVADDHRAPPAFTTVDEVEWPVRTSRRIPPGLTALRDWLRGIEPGLPAFDTESWQATHIDVVRAGEYPQQTTEVAGPPPVDQYERLLAQSGWSWRPWRTRP
jgi:hypothetical protein